MSLAKPKGSARAGFTLPEILVAVAMVGVLSAVVLPTVIGQVAKGEISRVVQDLQSVDQGAAMFRNDIGKWPATIVALVAAPANSGAALTGLAGATGNYPSNAATIWQGPYLARGDATGGVSTAGSGLIVATLRHVYWDGNDTATPKFVALEVTGLTAARKAAVDEAIDGVAGADINNPTHGKVRYTAGDGTALFYLTSPAQ